MELLHSNYCSEHAVIEAWPRLKEGLDQGKDGSHPMQIVPALLAMALMDGYEDQPAESQS